MTTEATNWRLTSAGGVQSADVVVSGPNGTNMVETAQGSEPPNEDDKEFAQIYDETQRRLLSSTTEPIDDDARASLIEAVDYLEKALAGMDPHDTSHYQEEVRAMRQKLANTESAPSGAHSTENANIDTRPDSQVNVPALSAGEQASETLRGGEDSGESSQEEQPSEPANETTNTSSEAGTDDIKKTNEKAQEIAAALEKKDKAIEASLRRIEQILDEFISSKKKMNAKEKRAITTELDKNILNVDSPNYLDLQRSLKKIRNKLSGIRLDESEKNKYRDDVGHRLSEAKRATSTADNQSVSPSERTETVEQSNLRNTSINGYRNQRERQPSASVSENTEALTQPTREIGIQDDVQVELLSSLTNVLRDKGIDIYERLSFPAASVNKEVRIRRMDGGRLFITVAGVRAGRPDSDEPAVVDTHNNQFVEIVNRGGRWQAIFNVERDMKEQQKLLNQIITEIDLSKVDARITDTLVATSEEQTVDIGAENVGEAAEPPVDESNQEDELKPNRLPQRADSAPPEQTGDGAIPPSDVDSMWQDSYGEEGVTANFGDQSAVSENQVSPDQRTMSGNGAEAQDSTTGQESQAIRGQESADRSQNGQFSENGDFVVGTNTVNLEPAANPASVVAVDQDDSQAGSISESADVSESAREETEQRVSQLNQQSDESQSNLSEEVEPTSQGEVSSTPDRPYLSDEEQETNFNQGLELVDANNQYLLDEMVNRLDRQRVTVGENIEFPAKSDNMHIMLMRTTDESLLISLVNDNSESWALDHIKSTGLMRGIDGLSIGKWSSIIGQGVETNLVLSEIDLQQLDEVLTGHAAESETESAIEIDPNLNEINTLNEADLQQRLRSIPGIGSQRSASIAKLIVDLREYQDGRLTNPIKDEADLLQLNIAGVGDVRAGKIADEFGLMRAIKIEPQTNREVAEELTEIVEAVNSNNEIIEANDESINETGQEASPTTPRGRQLVTSIGDSVRSTGKASLTRIRNSIGTRRRIQQDRVVAPVIAKLDDEDRPVVEHVAVSASDSNS